MKLEKNIAIVDLEEYNSLKMFMENNILTIKRSSYYLEDIYYSTDDAVKEIAKANKSLALELDKYTKERNYSLTELKNMSIWKFLTIKRRGY